MEAKESLQGNGFPEIGAWNFSGAWMLALGALPLPLHASRYHPQSSIFHPRGKKRIVCAMIRWTCFTTTVAVALVVAGCSSKPSKTSKSSTTSVSEKASAKPPKSSELHYPNTAKTNVVEDYHGTKVSDPYRWLEDDNSAETKAWVEAQNKVTFGYLHAIPGRDQIKAR